MSRIEEGETRPEPIILRPTPLETSLDDALRKHFDTPLLIGAIDQYYKYGRPSVLAPVNNMLVGFGYYRFNLLEAYPDNLVDAYLFLHPEERTFDETSQEAKNFEDVEWGGLYLAQLEVVLTKIKKNIVARYGDQDSALALTDPKYYLPEAPVDRWGERIRFVIFHDDNLPELKSPRAEIGPDNRIAGKQPNIHGLVSIAPSFSGLNGILEYREPPYNGFYTAQLVPHENRLFNAYSATFHPATNDELQRRGKVHNMVTWPRLRNDYEFRHRVDPSTPPEGIVDDLITFVKYYAGV